MRRALIAVALVAACVAAWIAYQHGIGVTAAPKEKAAAPPPVPVTVATAETRDVPVFVRGIGTVQAYNTVLVKSRIDGQIVKVDFTEGQEVKAGDPLFELDPRPAQAAVDQALANQQKDEAQLASAKADLERYAALVGKGYQTRQSYDQQKGLVGQLEAAIKADAAQIESARLNLQYCTVQSPIDGRTGARQVDVGNIVHTADNTALVTITELRPIYVTFNVAQDQFDPIRAGQAKAALEVEARTQGDDRTLATGKLTLIDNQIDQATGTVRLKATFANEDEALWPGAFVNVRLVTRIARNAVVVPARAIQQGPSGDYLFVVTPDATVEMRTVRVAQSENGDALVAEGLKGGERIVVDGQYRLDQGARVAARDAAAGASE
jgi:multidrug efflux system membrane fusion protein